MDPAGVVSLRPHQLRRPALIAVLIEEFARAATRWSSLSEEQARVLILSTLTGTARLLDEQGYTRKTILGRVSTPGGISEDGAQLLHAEMHSVYDNLIQRTLAKHGLLKMHVRTKSRPAAGSETLNRLYAQISQTKSG